MAAKRKRKSRSKTALITPWIAVAAGLAIVLVALVALLSGGADPAQSPTRPRNVSAPQASFDAGEAQDSNHDHDRDQIDQASRDQLREILRAAGGGGDEP